MVHCDADRTVLCMGDGIYDLLLTHVCDVFSCEDEVRVVAFLALLKEFGRFTLCISVRLHDSSILTASPLSSVILYQLQCVTYLCCLLLEGWTVRLVVCTLNEQQSDQASFRSYRDILHLQIVPNENSTTILVVWTFSYEWHSCYCRPCELCGSVCFLFLGDTINKTATVGT